MALEPPGKTAAAMASRSWYTSSLHSGSSDASWSGMIRMASWPGVTSPTNALSAEATNGRYVAMLPLVS